MRILKNSLGARLIIVIIMSIIISAGCITATLIRSQYQSQLNQMELDGVNMAKIAAKNIENVAKTHESNGIEEVQKAVDEIGKTDGMEYALVIDKDFIDVCDSTISDIGKKFDNDPGTKKTIVDRIQNTSFWTDDNGKKIFDVQIPVDFKIGSNQIASVDIGISLDNLYKYLRLSIIKGIALTFVFILIFSIIPSVILNIFVIKPLKKGAKFAGAIADKDLTIDFSTNRQDEIGMITQSILQAKNNLKDIIMEAQESSEQVASSSDILSQSLINTTASIQNITSFVNSMSNDLESNICIVKETNETMEYVTHNSKNAERAAIQISDYIEIVKNSALIGKNSTKEIVDIIGDISDSSNKMGDVIRELEIETRKIGGIVNIVSQIAEQTNLLALNAAIEAARAGDAGKGFAVVAEEVKKLAEQSSESLSGIIELTKSIEDKTKNVILMVLTTENKVENGVTKSNITKSNIDKIIVNVENVAETTSEITNMACDQTKLVDKIHELMNKITSSAKRGADESQEISSNIEEQMSVFEELSSTADELQNMASSLDKLVNQFKV